MAKRIGIYVDLSNLYYCLGKRYEGRRLDYSKYVEFIKDLGEIHQMMAYGAQIGRQADSFIHALKCIGFTTKYKPPKTYHNATGPVKRKADWDVGIAMDIVNIVERRGVDLIILGTADGDLRPCVEWIVSRGVEIVIMACGISRELKEVATKFIEIPETMLEEVKEIKRDDDNNDDS